MYSASSAGCRHVCQAHITRRECDLCRGWTAGKQVFQPSHTVSSECNVHHPPQPCCLQAELEKREKERVAALDAREAGLAAQQAALQGREAALEVRHDMLAML